MSVLFCHDGPVEKDEFNNYYGIGFNDKLFKKYEILDNDISIAIRVHKTMNNVLNDNYLPLKQYKVIECPNLASIKGIFLNKHKCIKILQKAIKESDIIVIRLPSNIGNLAAKIARKYKKRYIIELVGCPWDALKYHSFIGKLIAPIMYLKTKHNVKKAKNVIYVTEKFLQKRYSNDNNNIGCSDVILNNLDIKNLNKRIEKINSMNGKIILGTIGIVDIKYKGQEYVIKALRKLLDDGFTNIEYQLVGPGNTERLMNIAKKYNVLDKVKFIGPLTHDDIFKWLDKIDIYIQPSNTEGLPRSVIEAMSRGCPCIGSDVGGIPELISVECLFRKKDVLELRNKISNLLLSKKALEKNARYSFENARKYEQETLQNIRKNFYNQINLKEGKNE